MSSAWPTVWDAIPCVDCHELGANHPDAKCLYESTWFAPGVAYTVFSCQACADIRAYIDGVFGDTEKGRERRREAVRTLVRQCPRAKRVQGMWRCDCLGLVP